MGFLFRAILNWFQARQNQIISGLVYGLLSEQPVLHFGVSVCLFVTCLLDWGRRKPGGKEIRISHGPDHLCISFPDPFSASTCYNPIADLQPRANPES